VKRFALALYFAAIALWTGGLATISFVVAPTAFRQVSREDAGKVVGNSLRAFGRVEIGCGAVALAASLLLRRGGSWERVYRPTVLILMLLIALAYVVAIYPEAATARAKQAHEEFALMHRISVLLVATNILLGGTQLAVSAARLKAPDGA
jgi:uncharacterized membrane protein